MGLGDAFGTPGGGKGGNRGYSHADDEPTLPARDGHHGGKDRPDMHDSSDAVQLDVDESLMRTGPDGLTESEAQVRLAEFGRNELEEKANPKWKLLLKHFTGPMPCMIWVAIVIEAAISDWPNFWVLLALQTINGLAGFHEDSKAGDAVAALKASLKPEATVKRNGKWRKINAAELVPGDRVGLGSGANVPADCRLDHDHPIDIDQAALTGESLPVTMYKKDVAKMGSTVVRGETEAIVAATGKNTFFGKTAAMIQSVDEVGHFQRVLLKITYFLLKVSVALVSICLIYLIAKGESFLEALAFGVCLLVASIPIAMQVVCTTTMALGSRKLAEQKAIVARLSSIEQLAGMTMLCSDKTGTLTLNKMVLQDVFLYEQGVDRTVVLQHAALAAKWKEPAKDALDTLVLNAIKLEPLDAYTQLEFTPFDPVRKRTEAKLRGPDGRVFTVVKGAPHVVLGMVENKHDIEAEFDAKVDELADRGIRALAVARGFEGQGLRMMGLLTFLDPPRPDTKVTIERAVEQGVSVKMITGDHSAIAKETCRALGLGTNIQKADNLPAFDSKQDVPSTLGQDYGEAIEAADGFAQVFPEHKFLIVEALRQRGWSVGMTGDGVNDAPALKRADVGIAVQGSTDAARAAADLILTEAGLSVIVDAIIISRAIFQRMKNYVIYRVACTIQLLCFFFLAVILFHPNKYAFCDEVGRTFGTYVCDAVDTLWAEAKFFNLPVTCIVVITILNDGTIISIAYDHVVPSELPERWNLEVLFAVATWLGTVAVLSSMLLVQMALNANAEDSFFASMGFQGLVYEQVACILYLKISLSDFLTVFSARARGPFYERKPGQFLAAAAAFATLCSTFLATHWPFGHMQSISYQMAAFVWVYCVGWWFIQDAAKVALYSYLFAHDVSGLRTQQELCEERRKKVLTTEEKLAKLQEEVDSLRSLIAAASVSQAKFAEAAMVLPANARKVEAAPHAPSAPPPPPAPLLAVEMAPVQFQPVQMAAPVAAAPAPAPMISLL